MRWPASPDPEQSDEEEEEDEYPASPVYHMIYEDISDDNDSSHDNNNERDVPPHYAGIIWTVSFFFLTVSRHEHFLMKDNTDDIWYNHIRDYSD